MSEFWRYNCLQVGRWGEGQRLQSNVGMQPKKMEGASLGIILPGIKPSDFRVNWGTSTVFIHITLSNKVTHTRNASANVSNYFPYLASFSSFAKHDKYEKCDKHEKQLSDAFLPFCSLVEKSQKSNKHKKVEK